MNLSERNEKQRTFFNGKIDSYDETHEEFMKTKKALIDSLEPNTKKVLDLGAGTGLELIYLFQRFPDANVTVIDISEGMLNELSKREFAGKVSVVCGDFFKVDFGTEYDAVISTSALHHFTEEEKERLYRKIYECLKEKGLFINCDKISLTQEEQDHMFYELEHNIEYYKHIDTPLTVENEIKILEGNSFVEIETSETDKENYSLIKSRKK